MTRVSPRPVVFDHPDSTSVQLVWGPPSVPEETDSAAPYSLSMRELPDGEFVVVSDKIKGRTIVKKNLSPSLEYEFKVKRADASSFGEACRVSTKAGASTSLRASPPWIAFEAQPENESAAIGVIQWRPVSHPVSKYQIQGLALDGDSDWMDLGSGVEASKPTALRKRNLLIGQWYSFRVRGISDNGNAGVWSAPSQPQQAVLPAINPKISLAVASKLFPSPSSTSLVESTTLLGGKVIGLYFSASWCGPCRQMTPRLADFYGQMKSLGKPFEIVFVSCDHDAKSFKDYYAKMPWTAVPFEDERRQILAEEHRIQGIPAMVVLSSKTGAVVDAQALQKSLSASTVDEWARAM